MPDLGKYAGAVLSSYTVSLALLAVLVLVSVLRARRLKRTLSALEQRRERHG